MSVLVGFCTGKQRIVVLRHLLDDYPVIDELCRLFIQLALSLIPRFGKRFSFSFQRCNLLLQFGFVQKVGITGKNSHIFGEVHTVLLVHSTLVDSPCAHRSAFELVDECLFTVQQIEFVAVERFLHGVSK